MTLRERLMAVESDPIGGGLCNNRYRNPDGPEADARILALEAGLRRIATDVVAFDAHPVGVIETWRDLARTLLSDGDSGEGRADG